MTTRVRRLLKWIREGRLSSACDYEKHEDVVWWGFWRQCGQEEAQQPAALFPARADAEAFALLTGYPYDWHIGPCVLAIETRDNFEVPE